MSIKYIRHPENPSVLLADTAALEEYKSKKRTEDEMESLRNDINTLKQELNHLKSQLSLTKASE